MPDDSWLPVSIWNGLAEVTRNRLQDRNAGVRAAAVLVARKLQEPKNPNCEIVKCEYVCTMYQKERNFLF